MCKWSFRYWFLKWQIHRDHKFLLEKAFLKAKSEGLEINVGTRFICVPEEKKDRIYLPPAGDGVDVRNLLAFAIDDYPKVGKRWLDNRKMVSE